MRAGHDSRLAGINRRETHPVLPLERSYCTNCGKPHGWVSVDSNNNWLTDTGESISPDEIVVTCDDCETKFGAPDLDRLNLKEL